jgi:hypothetical protein
VDRAVPDAERSRQRDRVGHRAVGAALLDHLDGDQCTGRDVHVGFVDHRDVDGNAIADQHGVVLGDDRPDHAPAPVHGLGDRTGRILEIRCAIDGYDDRTVRHVVGQPSQWNVPAHAVSRACRRACIGPPQAAHRRAWRGGRWQRGRRRVDRTQRREHQLVGGDARVHLDPVQQRRRALQ